MQNHSPPSLKINYVIIVRDTLNPVWVSRYRPTIPHDSSGNYGRGVETISLISTFGEGLTKETAKEDAINRATLYLYHDVIGYKNAESLKRDSCCCGATKSNPCACMIQGVMKCSATCPCSLEN